MFRKVAALCFFTLKTSLLVGATLPVNNATPNAAGGLVVQATAAAPNDTLEFVFGAATTTNLTGVPLTITQAGLTLYNGSAGTVTIAPVTGGLFTVNGTGFFLGNANTDPALVIQTPIALGVVTNAATLKMNSSSVSLSGALSVGNGWTVQVSQPATFNGINLLGANAGIAFEVNTTVLGSVTVANSLITVLPSVVTTLSSPVAGTGFGFSGGGTLVLATANTYTGVTTLLGGTLSVLGDIALSTGMVIVDGTLDLSNVAGATATISNLSGIATTGVISLGGKSLNIVNTATTAATYAGLITGTTGANVTFSGTGTGPLVLTGTQTYIGNTTISTGIVALSGTGSIASSDQVTVVGTLDITNSANAPSTIQNLSGTGIVLLGSNVLEVLNTANNVFSGVISGAGSTIISGANSLSLSGVSTYTGTTTIAQGTLHIGNVAAIAASSSVINDSVLDVSPVGAEIQNLGGSGTVSLGASTLTVSSSLSSTVTGQFTGTGTVQKQGTGDWEVVAASPAFTGIFQVDAGRFGVNADLSGAILHIMPLGEAHGTGKIGSVINDGILAPGNSIGTFNVIGNYLQTGTLEVEIADTLASDLLNVGGTVTITGSVLNVSPILGIYYEGQRFTVVEAASIVGTYGAVQFPPQFDISVIYNPTSIVLVNNKGTLPVANQFLSGYAQAVANAIFCPAHPPAGDFKNVALSLVQLSPSAYETAMTSIVPAQITGLPIVEMENGNRMLASIQNRTYRHREMTEDKDENLPEVTVWATPTSFWLWQGYNGEAFAFKSNTSGFTLGFEHKLSPCFMMGLGGGYTYSGVNWQHNLGNAMMNEVYLAPYLSARAGPFYFAGALMGSYDHTQLNRHFSFDLIDRTARSQLDQLNFSSMADVRGVFGFWHHLYVVPEASVSVVQSYRMSAQEKGAGFLDMAYPWTYNSTIRAIGSLALEGRFEVKDLLTMGIIVNGGYQYTDLFTSNSVNANFLATNQVCDPHIAIYGNQPSKNQAIVGLGITLENDEVAKVELKSNYTFLGHSNLLEVNLNFETNF